MHAIKEQNIACEAGASIKPGREPEGEMVVNSFEACGAGASIKPGA